MYLGGFLGKRSLTT